MSTKAPNLLHALFPGDDIRLRAKAARVYLDASSSHDTEGDRERELRAFMEIFHPDHPLTKAPPFEFRKAFDKNGRKK